MLDASGRSVAAPLRRGSPYCLFHSRPFCTQLASVDGPIVLFYLDLETSASENNLVFLCVLVAMLRDI